MKRLVEKVRNFKFVCMGIVDSCVGYGVADRVTDLSRSNISVLGVFILQHLI